MPCVELGVPARLRGGEAKAVKKPGFVSPSPPAGTAVNAGGIGLGAEGALTVVMMVVVGSMSNDDKNEVLSKSSRVDVIVKNLSNKLFCSSRGAPLRSSICEEMNTEL